MKRDSLARAISARRALDIGCSMCSSMYCSTASSSWRPSAMLRKRIAFSSGTLRSSSAVDRWISALMRLARIGSISATSRTSSRSARASASRSSSGANATGPGTTSSAAGAGQPTNSNCRKNCSTGASRVAWKSSPAGTTTMRPAGIGKSRDPIRRPAPSCSFRYKRQKSRRRSVSVHQSATRMQPAENKRTFRDSATLGKMIDMGPHHLAWIINGILYGSVAVGDMNFGRL